jgi:hypothetical protein
MAMRMTMAVSIAMMILVAVSGEFLQHVFRTLEKSYTPMSKAMPELRLVAIDLLERNLTRAIVIKGFESARDIAWVTQFLHASLKLTQTDLMVVILIKMPQPSTESTPFGLVKKILDKVG